jgi:hypothetical protein
MASKAARTAITRRRRRTARRRDLARRRNSGDDSRVLRCAGKTTSDTVGFLTSLRGSWTASRRRGSGDRRGPTVAEARVPGGGGAQGSGRLGHGLGVLGVRRGLNSPEGGLLGVRAKTGACPRWRRGRARGRTRVRLGDEREEGDDTGAPPVSDRGRGKRRSGGLAAAVDRLGRYASWAAARAGLQRGMRWVDGLAATACWAVVAAGLGKVDGLK